MTDFIKVRDHKGHWTRSDGVQQDNLTDVARSPAPPGRLDAQMDGGQAIDTWPERSAPQPQW